MSERPGVRRTSAIECTTVRRAGGTAGNPPSRCRRPSHRARWIAVAWVLLAAVGAQAAPTAEYQLKAAFLFNFAKFTDWPDDVFAGPGAPFAVCVLGRDPFGSSLDDTLRGKTIANRPVAVERLRDLAGVQRCQMVFVTQSETGRLPAILRALRGAKSLVVGETAGFAHAGGAIEFTLEDERVRFTINPDATERAGLRISSQLLGLARIVHDDPADGKS